MTSIPDRHGVATRRVRPEDWAALKALRVAMLADTPIAFSETVEKARRRPDDEWIARATKGSTSEAVATWVAESDREIVGMLAGLADDARTWIVSVYLDPGYRGLGLLGELLEHAATWSLE